MRDSNLHDEVKEAQERIEVLHPEYPQQQGKKQIKNGEERGIEEGRGEDSGRERKDGKKAVRIEEFDRSNLHAEWVEDIEEFPVRDMLLLKNKQVQNWVMKEKQREEGRKHIKEEESIQGGKEKMEEVLKSSRGCGGGDRGASSGGSAAAGGQTGKGESKESKKRTKRAGGGRRRRASNGGSAAAGEQTGRIVVGQDKKERGEN